MRRCQWDTDNGRDTDNGGGEGIYVFYLRNLLSSAKICVKLHETSFLYNIFPYICAKLRHAYQMDTNYIDILISAVLAFVMLGIGMSLTWGDFRQVLAFQKPLWVGLLLQILIVPVLSFGIAYYWQLPTNWKVGFVILAICPGGTTASFISYLFKGNVALAIALTTINSFLTLFTIPLISNFALRFFAQQDALIQLPFWETFLHICLITIVPATIGVLIRQVWADFAQQAQHKLKFVTVFMLGIIFIAKIFGGGKASISAQDILQLLPITFILNVLGLSLGYLGAKMVGLTRKDSFTIGTEMAIHNTTLAFLVTDTLLHTPDLSKPALVYSLFSFWTAVLFGWGIMRKSVFSQ